MWFQDSLLRSLIKSLFKYQINFIRSVDTEPTNYEMLTWSIHSLKINSLTNVFLFTLSMAYYS